MNKALMLLVCFAFLVVLGGVGNAREPMEQKKQCDAGVLNKSIQYIDSCQTLNQSNTIYYLNRDLSADEVTEKCMNIQAEGVTLDCQNHFIVSPLQAFLIFSIYSDQQYTTIRNCDLRGPETGSYGRSRGITFRPGGNGLIENNNISGFGTGLDIQSGNNTIRNNIAENNIKSIHVMGGSANNNIVKNNLVKTNKRYQGWGLAVWTGLGNQFINNKVYGNDYGIVLYGADNTVLKCDQYSSNYLDIALYRDNNYGKGRTNHNITAYGVSYTTKAIGTGAEFIEKPDDCSDVECTWQGDECVEVADEQKYFPGPNTPPPHRRR